MPETSLVDDYVSNPITVFDRASGKYNSLFSSLPEEITQFSLRVLSYLNFFVRYTYRGVNRGFEIQHRVASGVNVKTIPETAEVTLVARPLKDRYFEQPIVHGRWHLLAPRFASQLIELTYEYPDNYVGQTIYCTWNVPDNKDQRRAKAYLHALGGNYVSAVVTELEEQVRIIFSNRSGKLDELVFNWLPDTKEGLVLLCTHPNGPYYFNPGKRQLPHVEYLKYANIVVDCYHQANEGTNWGNFQRKKK